MPRTTATEFAAIARWLGAECHRQGIVTPAFRSPPRSNAQRTIRRCPSGVVVSVRLDRDPRDVASDMIDGCIAAAGVPEAEGQILRTALWEAAGLALAA